MTIEEKAKEFSENNITCSQDILQVIKMGSKHDHDSFIAGAKWMFEKAVKWLKENAQNYYEDSSMHDNCWYDDEQMIEDFQKAMEE